MKKVDFHRLLIAFSIVFSLDTFAEQNPLTLTVLVDGAKANTGQAIASLFSSADNYLKEPVYKHISELKKDLEIVKNTLLCRHTFSLLVLHTTYNTCAATIYCVSKKLNKR